MQGISEKCDAIGFGRGEGKRRAQSDSALRSLALAGVLCLIVTPVSAETLFSALSKAYLSNPNINQQRASVRSTDENVARQKSGWRPTINAGGDLGWQHTENGPNSLRSEDYYNTYPRGVGVTITQNIWNGNRTVNGIRQAESGVMGARETLRGTEQSVLTQAVTYYMDVLRDTAILDLRRNNVAVLEVQLRQTNERFTVGEITRTDVAQAEAQLAQGKASALQAESNLFSSIANYRQVIGDVPKNLAPAPAAERWLPKKLDQAIDIALRENPQIQSLMHSVDSAALNVKLIEGELYPTLNVQGQVQKRWDTSTPGTRRFQGSVTGVLNVPIYEGGQTYARVRQAKEQLSQARLQVDVQRNQVRAQVQSSWSYWENSLGIISAAQVQVASAEIALNGVREEAKVGQRTTFDVLQQQQLLLDARVSLVSAQHDRIVNSYNLLSSIGSLNAQKLNLQVARYDPTVHFDQVKNKWIGLRTPDGK